MIPLTTNTYIHSCFLCMIFLCLCFHCCSSKDNITTGESIQDGKEYLESADTEFQMGFIPVGPDQQRYIGIWYAKDPTTVVWVGNRDSPLPQNSTGVLTIAENGDVKVLDDKHQNAYFNITVGQARSIVSTYFI